MDGLGGVLGGGGVYVWGAAAEGSLEMKRNSERRNSVELSFVG